MKVPESIIELLAEIKKETEKEVFDSKIKLQVKIPSNDIVVSLDKMQFKRVIINIIKNSIYFLKEVRRQGKIIAISTESSGGFLFVKIEDHGRGIDEQDRDKIFDLFYTTKGDKGMGLGLALGQRIVREHQGEITVNSHWGHYTEFTITVPLNSCN